ncbi:MAG: FAD-dependent oxidoreductase [Proteobacteria bacterium]|nr:FAD-dependent oxidoreductase [Pseudomonadota bacterium]
MHAPDQGQAEPALGVIGGGIGGLAAAIAAAQAGWRVSLWEQANAFGEVGAGIQLGPNATRRLQHWGVLPSLLACAVEPAALHVRCASGGVTLGRLPLASRAQARYGAPYLTLHRADLHAALLQHAQQHRVTAHTAAEVSAIDPQTGMLRVHQIEYGAQALVLADGVWSRLRAQVVDAQPPLPTTHVAYRALPLQQVLPAACRTLDVQVWLAPQAHVVVYPVRRGEMLNVAVFLEGAEAASLAPRWQQMAQWEALQSRLPTFCAPLRTLLEAAAEAGDGWRQWPVVQRPPLVRAEQMAWARVALVGDAAHPMLPYMAQGAGMAIEDAHALGQALAGATSVEHALAGYAAARWRRNARVQARAQRNARWFHAQGVSAWLRNQAMAWLGTRVLDVPWLYRG